MAPSATVPRAMRGEDHYATLGLRPGAGQAEVADAYRRLIKQYHPDRMGGDASRAAEINRAYTQLRRTPAAPDRRPPMRVQPSKPARNSLKAPFFLIVATMFGVAAVSYSGILRGEEWLPAARESYAYQSAPATVPQVELAVDFDSPLALDLVSRAVEQAFAFHSAGAHEEAAQFSRECHQSLLSNPGLAWFDSCSAFDEAMMRLQGDGADLESGLFTWRAVMSRELAAARSMAGDSLVADSRLNAIRLQVDLQILPRLDSAAVTAAG